MNQTLFVMLLLAAALMICLRVVPNITKMLLQRFGGSSQAKTKLYWKDELPENTALYDCRIDGGPALKLYIERTLLREDFPGADRVVSRSPFTLQAKADGVYAVCGNRNITFVNNVRVFKGETVKLAARNSIRMQVGSAYQCYTLSVTEK